MCGQHVPDLARADPKGKRTKGRMGACMTIPAGQGHSRLGKPKLRPDNVNDPLPMAVQAVKFDAKLGDILLQGLQQFFGLGVQEGAGTHVRRHNMVNRGKGPLRKGNIKALFSQHVECRSGSDLMNQMKANKNLILASGKPLHCMRFPDLIV